MTVEVGLFFVKIACNSYYQEQRASCDVDVMQDEYAILDGREQGEQE